LCFYQVGFFPAECVEMIGEKVLQSVATKIPVSPKPGNKFISSKVISYKASALCFAWVLDAKNNGF